MLRNSRGRKNNEGWIIQLGIKTIYATIVFKIVCDFSVVTRGQWDRIGNLKMHPILIGVLYIMRMIFQVDEKFFQ